MENQDFILKVLQKMRPLFTYMADSPDRIIKELNQLEASRHMVFPCDMIDLRRFLIEDKISFSNPIPFFSQRFAEKYLKEYSLFLVVDSHTGIMNSLHGGIQLNYCEELPLSSLITRIIVNEPSANNSFDVVKGLIKEFNLGVECLVSNSVPGISGPSRRLSYIIEPKKAQKTDEQSNIILSPTEKNIFDFLRKVKEDYNLNIQFRVAGGWTRDKLMGQESDDIDIAISNMTGSQLVSYIKKHPQARKVMGKDYTVPINPDKSKHLETVSIELFGNKIDFVNLRSETYGDTRIPEMKMGKPKTDAERRDLTINALFYNIETGKVEDYVGGLRDMNNKILRTPMDPIQTFKDDPLRMLRVVRFKSRFPDFQVASELVEAMKDIQVQEAYKNKVSAERAGPELMKTMTGEDPAEALKLLFETGLYKEVFKVTSMNNINPEGIHMDQKSPYHKYNLLEHTLKVVSNLNKIMKDNGEDNEIRGLMNLAAVFHDFGKMDNQISKPHKNPKLPGHTSYVGHEISSEAMAEKILKSIGVSKDKRDLVNTVIKTHMYPHDASGWRSKNKGPGQFIEELKIKGNGAVDDLWKYVFYLGQADAMSSDPKTYNEEKYKQGRDWFEQYRSDPAIEFTRVQGTLINGDIVDNIRQEVEQQKQVSIRKNIISDTLKFILQQQYTGNINMSFASLPEGPEKEKALNAAMEEESKKARSWMLNSYDKYLEPPKGGKVMGSNWFKKVKTSQIAPLSIENSEVEDPEIKKGPKKALPKYRVGMRVRDRRQSISQPQNYGRVEAIKGNKIKIVWNPDSKENRQEEIVDMVEDIEILSLIVEEV